MLSLLNISETGEKLYVLQPQSRNIINHPRILTRLRDFVHFVNRYYITHFLAQHVIKKLIIYI